MAAIQIVGGQTTREVRVRHMSDISGDMVSNAELAGVTSSGESEKQRQVGPNSTRVPTQIFLLEQQTEFRLELDR